VGSGPPEPHATPTERVPVLDLQTLLRRTLGDPDEVLPATRPALEFVSCGGPMFGHWGNSWKTKYITVFDS